MELLVTVISNEHTDYMSSICRTKMGAEARGKANLSGVVASNRLLRSPSTTPPSVRERQHFHGVAGAAVPRANNDAGGVMRHFPLGELLSPDETLAIVCLVERWRGSRNEMEG
jgi:hypothetical protein